MVNKNYKSRILSLDLLRGIAVILMVQQHTGYWFWKSGGSMGSLIKQYPFMVTINGLGGLAAPLFITLAGIGTALSYEAGRKGREIFLRGILLIIFGYILSILTPAWFAPWSWYVLHLMGLGMCMSPMFRRTSSPVLLVTVFVIIMLSAVLLSAFDMPRYFSNTFMRGTFSAAAIMKLVAFSGNFPVFPWLALFITGFVSGRWITGERYINLVKLSALFTGIALLLLLVKQGHFGLFNNGWGRRMLIINLYMYPAYPMQFLALSVVSLLSVYAAVSAGKRYAINEKNMLVLLGRASLTVFIVHIVTIRNFMMLSGLWQTFSEPVTILLQLAVIALIILLVHIWKKKEFRYGFEWMLRKVK